MKGAAGIIYVYVYMPAVCASYPAMKPVMYKKLSKSQQICSYTAAELLGFT